MSRASSRAEPVLLVVMGVTSVGKSTVGRILAERLGAVFAEGDDYHPPANVAKMHSGTPLDDDDRRPWLEAIARDLERWRAEGRSAVVTCSALKRSYREILRGAGPNVRFVHLTGEAPLIARRMAGRSGHFMPPSLLPSQLATLESPDPAEGAISIDVIASPAEIAAAIMERLQAPD
jgi:gluconokinase